MKNIVSYYLYIRWRCLKNTNLNLKLLNFLNHVKAGLKECIMNIRTLKNIRKTKISIYGFQFMTWLPKYMRNIKLRISIIQRLRIKRDGKILNTIRKYSCFLCSINTCIKSMYMPMIMSLFNKIGLPILCRNYWIWIWIKSV